MSDVVATATIYRSKVIVAKVGIPGPKGDLGDDKTYVHTQGAPATTWICPHNLGKIPSVQLLDSIGRLFQASISHSSLNESVITCSPAMSGTAIFN